MAGCDVDEDEFVLVEDPAAPAASEKAAAPLGSWPAQHKDSDDKSQASFEWLDETLRQAISYCTRSCDTPTAGPADQKVRVTNAALHAMLAKQAMNQAGIDAAAAAVVEVPAAHTGATTHTGANGSLWLKDELGRIVIHSTMPLLVAGTDDTKSWSRRPICYPVTADGKRDWSGTSAFRPELCKGDVHGYIDLMPGPMDKYATIDRLSFNGLIQRVGPTNDTCIRRYLTDMNGHWNDPAYLEHCYGNTNRADLHAFCRGKLPKRLAPEDPWEVD